MIVRPRAISVVARRAVPLPVEVQGRQQAQREEDERRRRRARLRRRASGITGTIAVLPIRLTAVPHVDPATLRAAYAECERLARAHYENFPVASWLAAGARCGRTSRRSTRLRARPTTSPTRAQRPAEERLRLLDDWQNRLHACVDGR